MDPEFPEASGLMIFRGGGFAGRYRDAAASRGPVGPRGIKGGVEVCTGWYSDWPGANGGGDGFDRSACGGLFHNPSFKCVLQWDCRPSMEQ